MAINGHDNYDFANGINDLIPDRAELECEELFIQADRLLGENATLEAVEKLSQILKRNPRFGKAYNHLGWVYETKYKNSQRAEEYYKAAIAYAPNYNAVYLNYCYLLSNAARFSSVTSQTNREFDSENNADIRCNLSDDSSRGMLSKSDSTPNPPAKAISAKATANPPSLRSWQLRTKPLLIARCTDSKIDFARGPSTVGTLPRR